MFAAGAAVSAGRGRSGHSFGRVLATLAQSLLISTALLGFTASATYTCDTSFDNGYPYCINVPAGASASNKFPTILFLSGSGARGSTRMSEADDME
jgi:predicted peptidase